MLNIFIYPQGFGKKSFLEKMKVTLQRIINLSIPTKREVRGFIQTEEQIYNP